MGKRGRPTKYKAEYCEEVIELGREGYTIVEMAAEFDVARKTFYEWMEKHEDFCNAVSRALDIAESWWTRQGKKGIWSRDFNSSAYQLQMMNRFKWGKKSDHTHSGPDGGPLTVKTTHEIVTSDADD